jgi:hypothetical protein
MGHQNLDDYVYHKPFGNAFVQRPAISQPRGSVFLHAYVDEVRFREVIGLRVDTIQWSRQVVLSSNRVGMRGYPDTLESYHIPRMYRSCT